MFKPMLAAKADLSKIKFPVIASPKLDGIRAMTIGPDAIRSRNLKVIPNRYIQSIASGFSRDLDGEILTYTNGVRDDFNTVQSKVMSADGTPDFIFHVFDSIGSGAFHERLSEARFLHDHIVDHRTIETIEELDDYERECVEVQGWEGIMLRDPNGPYKQGRSTVNEGYLLKVKRFEDDEAIIVDMVERMHNANEATINALGHTERSSHKANLVPTQSLGAFVCKWKDLTFELGTGFTEDQRQTYWRDPLLIGEKVTFKYQGVGTNGRPRFPSFIGIRRDI